MTRHQVGHRLSPEGVLETRQWFRRVQRRMRQTETDRLLLLARFGDLLETVATLSKRKRRSAKKEVP